MDVFSNAFSETPQKIEIPADEPETEVKDEPAKESPEPKVDEKSEPSEQLKDGLEAKEEPKDAARDESGRFVKSVPQEALHAARRKADALEAELALLKQEKAKPPTSVLEDEDKAFQERLTEAMAPIRQQIFEQSIEAAREKPGRDDFDEIYSFMEQECAAHPEIVQQIVTSARPGETIYQLGKTRKELADVGGDITKLRQSIETKFRDKEIQSQTRIKALEAEIAGLKASKEKREAIPQSLNAEQSGSVKDEAYKGPTPLKDVLPKI